jgi:hypothetical protein
VVRVEAGSGSAFYRWRGEEEEAARRCSTVGRPSKLGGGGAQWRRYRKRKRRGRAGCECADVH